MDERARRLPELQRAPQRVESGKKITRKIPLTDNYREIAVWGIDKEPPLQLF